MASGTITDIYRAFASSDAPLDDGTAMAVTRWAIDKENARAMVTLAGRADLPVEAVDLLLGVRHAEVRAAVLGRHDLGVGRVEQQVAAERRATVLAAAVAIPGASDELLFAAVRDTRPTVLRAVLVADHAPLETRLAAFRALYPETDSPAVDNGELTKFALEHPEVHDELALDSSDRLQVRRQLVDQPLLSAAARAALVTDFVVVPAAELVADTSSGSRARAAAGTITTAEAFLTNPNLSDHDRDVLAAAVASLRHSGTDGHDPYASRAAVFESAVRVLTQLERVGDVLHATAEAAATSTSSEELDEFDRVLSAEFVPEEFRADLAARLVSNQAASPSTTAAALAALGPDPLSGAVDTLCRTEIGRLAAALDVRPALAAPALAALLRISSQQETAAAAAELAAELYVRVGRSGARRLPTSAAAALVAASPDPAPVVAAVPFSALPSLINYSAAAAGAVMAVLAPTLAEPAQRDVLEVLGADFDDATAALLDTVRVVDAR